MERAIIQIADNLKLVRLFATASDFAVKRDSRILDIENMVKNKVIHIITDPMASTTDRFYGASLLAYWTQATLLSNGYTCRAGWFISIVQRPHDPRAVVWEMYRRPRCAC